MLGKQILDHMHISYVEGIINPTAFFLSRREKQSLVSQISDLPSEEESGGEASFLI